MNSTKPTPKNESLERAIAHFDTLSEMARELGLSGYQVVQHWRRSGRVPPEYCTELSRLTGERREDLVGWPPTAAIESIEATDDVQPPVGDADHDSDGNPPSDPGANGTESK
jgi:hypothetical protein